jgi:hypothetical protein
MGCARKQNKGKACAKSPGLGAKHAHSAPGTARPSNNAVAVLRKFGFLAQLKNRNRERFNHIQTADPLT